MAFQIVLDELESLNSAFFDWRQSSVYIGLLKAIFLSRTKRPINAQSSLDSLKTELPSSQSKDLHPTDQFLLLFYKFTSGIVKLSLNKFGDALVELISLVSSIQELESSKKEKLRRKEAVLLLSGYFWLAFAYKQKRWLNDCVKYCKVGIKMFERDIPEFQEEEDFKIYHERLQDLLIECRKAISRQFRIERKFQQIEVGVPDSLKPGKTTDYKDEGFYHLKDTWTDKYSSAVSKSALRNSQSEWKKPVDPEVGIKMRNTECHHFYLVGPVKFLDEFSPEFDKTERVIRSIGKSLKNTKFSPYKNQKKTANSIFSKSVNQKQFRITDPALSSSQVRPNKKTSNNSIFAKKEEIYSELGPRKQGKLLDDLKGINKRMEQM